MNIPLTVDKGLNPRAFLTAVAGALRDAPRLGGEHDEPEGDRYIQLSSTLATDLAERFEEIANEL